jgi:cytochrome c peroxidase
MMMMRHVVSGLAAAAFASTAMAQQPDPFGRQFMQSERNRGITWALDDRLVFLGQRLFFDVRLSGTATTACASCHDPSYAFAEPRHVSISDSRKLGRRNAPSLLDVGFLPTLMWDGRFGTLEQQALSPFERGEMGIGVDQAVKRVSSDPQYVHLFRAALGRWPTANGVARALAAFQRTLVSPASRVDRFLVNNEAAILTPLEQHGFYVFTQRAPCSNCHQLFPLQPNGRVYSRPLLTDFRFHNLGVGYSFGGFADTGRYGLSHLNAEWGAFRTPSLRNSARTPPYMHDGSLATLEDVVEFYNAGGRPNPNLSPLIRPLFLDGYEKAALVAFLRALSDPDCEC